MPALATPIANVSSIELEDTGMLAQAVDSAMATRGTVLWADGSGVEAGIWSCAPGKSRWNLLTHEFIYVVSGRMTVTRDGGEPLEITAGCTAFFEKGWQGTWLIHETITKSYVAF
jgi:uncharacterized cupin superfamily protein